MLVDSAFQSATDAKHERGSLFVLSCYPLYYPPAKLCRKSRMKIKGNGDDGFQGIDLGSMTVFKRHISRAVAGRYRTIFQHAIDGSPYLTLRGIEEFRQFPLAHPDGGTGDTKFILFQINDVSLSHRSFLLLYIYCLDVVIIKAFLFFVPLRKSLRGDKFADVGQLF